MSDSFVTSWTGPPWPLCPWDFPGKNTWVGCHYLLWGIFPTQELNPCLLNLLHWQADALPLCNQGNTFFIVSNNQFDNQLFWHGITVCEFFEYPGTMVYSFHLFFRPNFLKFFFPSHLFSSGFLIKYMPYHLMFPPQITEVLIISFAVFFFNSVCFGLILWFYCFVFKFTDYLPLQHLISSLLQIKLSPLLYWDFQFMSTIYFSIHLGPWLLQSKFCVF